MRTGILEWAMAKANLAAFKLHLWYAHKQGRQLQSVYNRIASVSTTHVRTVALLIFVHQGVQQCQSHATLTSRFHGNLLTLG